MTFTYLFLVVCWHSAHSHAWMPVASLSFLPPPKPRAQLPKPDPFVSLPFKFHLVQEALPILSAK